LADIYILTGILDILTGV